MRYIDLDGLSRYVGGGSESLAEDLAVAWLMLSDPRDRKGNRSFPGEYFHFEWSKNVRRRLRGYAETHARPSSEPWNDPAFDIFTWLSD